jgi:hypothetical protein
VEKAKRKEIHHLLTRKTDRIEYSEEPGYLYRTPLHQGYAIGLPDEDPSGWAEFDDGRDVDGSEPIFFLHLATVDDWKDPKVEHYGLLLVKNTAQKEVYNRVGIGTAWDVTWMADAVLPIIQSDCNPITIRCLYKHPIWALIGWNPIASDYNRLV